MDCRTDESCSFKRRLGFKLRNVINTKQQTIAKTIKEIFEAENIQDTYFHKYKIDVEVDEYGDKDRDSNYEEEREKAIKEKFGWIFIRINPDEINFSISRSMKDRDRLKTRMKN